MDAPKAETGPNTPIGGPRAVNWAMARIRERVNGYPRTPNERAVILAGIGPSVYRSVMAREVRTRGEVAAMVAGIIGRLDEAESVSGGLRAACKYGRWVVRQAVAEAITRAARAAETRAFEERARRRELEAEGRAARASWTPAAVAQVEALVARAIHPARGLGPSYTVTRKKSALVRCLGLDICHIVAAILFNYTDARRCRECVLQQRLARRCGHGRSLNSAR